ncbi:hypothetical protein KY284_004806 [Solanum tuberosum]|nr:hypothetical protein KY284_004806 [Solanum tuberosum]
MEPPFKQSYFGCKFLLHWPEEVKDPPKVMHFWRIDTDARHTLWVHPVAQPPLCQDGWREEVLSVLFRIPTCPFISMQNVLCCPCIQITRNCLQQQRVLSQCTPPSGLSISVQQPILGFFPSAKVQIGREGTHGSDDLHTEVGGNVDLELKL